MTSQQCSYVLKAADLCIDALHDCVEVHSLNFERNSCAARLAKMLARYWVPDKTAINAGPGE